jgi:hypothetical protein
MAKKHERKRDAKTTRRCSSCDRELPLEAFPQTKIKKRSLAN